MLNFAINNETAERANSLPFLTDNLIYKGYDVMAKKQHTTVPEIRLSRRIPVNPGDRFGRLTIISEAPRKIEPSGHSRRMVDVICDCGVKKSAQLRLVKSGATKSCGCLQREHHATEFRTHGLSKHPTFKVWTQMNSRCNCKTNPAYQSYGGRGICICDEWSEFPPFYEWAMSNGWKKGLMFDRENVNREYSPDNCRFVSKTVSNRNTRLLRSDNKSGYRGVNAKGKRWMASIRYNNKTKHIGTFDTAIEAGHAYDKMAKSLDSNYPLNFPEDI